MKSAYFLMFSEKDVLHNYVQNFFCNLMKTNKYTVILCELGPLCSYGMVL